MLVILFKEIDAQGTSKLAFKENISSTLKLFESLWITNFKFPELSKHLINIYPLKQNKFFLQIAFIENNENSQPIINTLYTLIAIVKENKVYFASSIIEHTSNWKNTSIGRVNYFYKSKLNLKVAEKFNESNFVISKKLGVDTSNLIFYKCQNYQESMKILGIDYSKEQNGVSKSSTIFDNIIISGLNSEDFSHDIFHHYSSKLYDRGIRNWTSEEGLAYSWGNAYYTKENNEMISRNELVYLLKDYIKAHPKVSLLEIFIDNPKIVNDLSPLVSVKSVISSLLCDEVENEKGIKGVKELISCGKGDTMFFKTINKLIKINKTNFNRRVKNIIKRKY
jgi:hypothetical protein